MVCAANVCRSPLSAFLLQRELNLLPGFDGVVVESAGVSARAGAEICERVRSSRRGDNWEAFAESHRSRPITAELIDGAALILTASTAERSAIAALAPTARARTFTLREAAALAVAPGFADETEIEATGVLERFAAVVHGRRGFAEPGRRSTGRRLFGRSKGAAEPFDIADGHLLGTAAHDRTITEIGEVVDTIAAALPSTALRGAV